MDGLPPDCSHLNQTRHLLLLLADSNHSPEYHYFRAIPIRTSVGSTGLTLAFDVQRYHSQRKSPKALHINWHLEHTSCIEMALFGVMHIWAYDRKSYTMSAPLSRFGPFEFALPKKVAYQSGRIGMKTIAQAFNPLGLTKAIG